MLASRAKSVDQLDQARCIAPGSEAGMEVEDAQARLLRHATLASQRVMAVRTSGSSSVGA